ncbi:MAG: hypothetical protein Ct9H300mP14_14680 [Gammaproteobacteria bacterium]|nr:MAG: hypothetical protein Ct9H300mP14_14680 [Gammaproteobacteria bacterium]
MNLYELDTVEVVSGLKARSFSVVELVQVLLARIADLDHLQAWVHVDSEAAMTQARQKQTELDAGSVGPLIGVPTGVKDIFYTAGVPTTACSKVYADFVPEYDATTVARLQGAGGIMFGEDSHHRVCLSRPVSNAQSLEHRPYPWRFEQWLGCCRCRDDVSDRIWKSDPGFGTSACFL